MAEDKMSAEELSEIALTIYDAPDDEFSFSCGAAKRLMRHITSLTSRAEKAEREVAEAQGRINVLLDDLKECGEEAEDDAVRTIRAENAIAALKAEAERMRGALEKAERRALDYFMIAQRSEEITPEDIAWANEAAARLSSEQKGGK